MSEPVEWLCEGCGVRVIAFGVREAPRHQLCATCTWLCEAAADPEEMMRMYRRLVQPEEGR